MRVLYCQSGRWRSPRMRTRWERNALSASVRCAGTIASSAQTGTRCARTACDVWWNHVMWSFLRQGSATAVRCVARVRCCLECTFWYSFAGRGVERRTGCARARFGASTTCGDGTRDDKWKRSEMLCLFQNSFLSLVTVTPCLVVRELFFSGYTIN